jgi:hypothetical protein
MAVDLTQGGTILHPTQRGARLPYAVMNELDLAVATTAKGSALANGEILNAINVPKNTLLHGATAEIVVAANTSTGATFDMDVAEGDDFVDGGDLLTAGHVAPGSNGLYPFGANTVGPAATADTIDVKLIAPGSVALASGKIRVWAWMTDVSDLPMPTETSRDKLA